LELWDGVDGGGGAIGISEEDRGDLILDEEEQLLQVV